jgi:uncharacterized caspase-like protein
VTLGKLPAGGNLGTSPTRSSMRSRALASALLACALLLLQGFILQELLATPAWAQGRVALVIGNAAYRSAPGLANPANDATEMSAALERLGFSVKLLADATFDDMRRALLEFNRRARGADMAVVFYAGHGMEIGGENWLIPVDARLDSDIDADSEAIGLKTVMLSVSSAKELGLVILDACRNNPFAAKMQRTARVRAVERGLTRVEPGDNVLVAYAARDGTTATDGDGRNSPFTTALLRYLEQPGLEITFMLRNVRDDVMAATNREQQPFVYGSLSRNSVYLKPPLPDLTRTTAPAASAVPAAPPPPVSNEAERAWAAAKDTRDAVVLRAFIKRFPDTFYADLARSRLANLEKAPEPPAAPVRRNARQEPASAPTTPRLRNGGPRTCSAQLAGCQAHCVSNGGGPNCATTFCVARHAECMSSGCWHGPVYNACGLAKR